MSQFSGKCDLYDSVVMMGQYDIKNISLYLQAYGRRFPLKIEESRDLIPYYPYVPGISGYSDGKYKAWISKSWVDVEEDMLLTTQLKYLLAEYRKCKRKKIEFVPPTSDWYNKKLIERVREQGEKATFEGIHLPMSNNWRRALAEEMEKADYNDNEIVCWIYPDAWLSKFDWRKDDY